MDPMFSTPFPFLLTLRGPRVVILGGTASASTSGGETEPLSPLTAPRIITSTVDSILYVVTASAESEVLESEGFDELGLAVELPLEDSLAKLEVRGLDLLPGRLVGPHDVLIIHTSKNSVPSRE